MDLKVAKRKFWDHRGNAKKRNIPFLLTFEDWCYIWEQSGKWDQRGCQRGKYVMSRYGDKGLYELGNVHIQLHDLNISQAQLGKTGNVYTEDSKAKMRRAKLNKPKIKVTCPHCNLKGQNIIMYRWHFDNCKRNTPIS
jgi:hypothetical protein